MSHNQNSKPKDQNANGEQSIRTIEGTNRTPKIILDLNKGDFYFSGCSMPENVNEFYSPILGYFDQYLEKPSKQSRVIFNLEYINSSSSQMLLAVLYKLRRLIDQSYSVKVEWHYMEDDDDIYETGKTFSELSEIAFEFYQHS